MRYRIETYYPDAGMFMPTNHVSEDLDALKQLVTDDRFRGFRVRLADGDGNVVFTPQFRERAGDLTVSDIANVLGVPILFPEEFPDQSSDADD